MEHVGRHHQGQFGVLVHLCPVEIVAIHHGDRLLAAELQPLELLQVGDWVDTSTTNGVVVPGDGPDHADAWVFGALHHGHHLRGEEEMAKVVDLQLLFMPVHCPLGVVQGGLVHGRVARKPVDGVAAPELVQLLDEGLHGVKACEVEVHGREVLRGETLHFGDDIHLGQVTDRADDVVLLGPQERPGGGPAETGRRAGDDDELLVAKLRAHLPLEDVPERRHLDIRHPLVPMCRLRERQEEACDEEHGLHGLNLARSGTLWP
mmetsp:Transcript_47720/g.147506  ORF Transcript_47720/g.147506 Transcript_47720/m.147506 type:complete len:262 (+) Transcript_47720:1578-2363(+)